MIGQHVDQRLGKRLGQALLAALWLVAAAAAAYKLAARPAPANFAVPNIATPAVAMPSTTALAATTAAAFITPPDARAHVHASSLVEIAPDRVRAVWFSGSREGGADVTIQTAVYHPLQRRWSAEQTIATRAATEAATLRATRKLGNPVIARHSDGRLWLFYVSVAIGGWAGSSINAMHSSDDGDHWSTPTRLITTPFFNLSTLVRTQPVLGSDGTMLLPVYHQFLGKFAELLRIDRNGNVVDKQRLSWGRGMLQPALLPLSATDALVLMRTGGSDLPDRVMATRTTDAGVHWTTPAPMTLRNPDSALAGVVLSEQRMLVVLNDSESDRDVLALALSADQGSTWRVIQVLEDERPAAALATDPLQFAARATEAGRETTAGRETSADRATDGRGNNARQQMCVGRSRCGFEFSYPSMLVTKNGDIHIAYTWHRSAIKHIVLNAAAVEEANGRARER